MKAPLNPSRKIKSATTLKRILARKRDVVFTNGCFDLLHVGHVDYLTKARKLGSCLVVALNSDRSVKKIKGPSRPLNPLKDRLKIIAALEVVDFVTWFEEETPYQLIDTLKPRTLVKGGDWSPSKIVGADLVLKRGGKVRSISFVPGKSTTGLVRKIHKQRKK